MKEEKTQIIIIVHKNSSLSTLLSYFLTHPFSLLFFLSPSSIQRNVLKSDPITGLCYYFWNTKLSHKCLCVLSLLQLLSVHFVQGFEERGRRRERRRKRWKGIRKGNEIKIRERRRHKCYWWINPSASFFFLLSFRLKNLCFFQEEDYRKKEPEKKISPLFTRKKWPDVAYKRFVFIVFVKVAQRKKKEMRERETGKKRMEK